MFLGIDGGGTKTAFVLIDGEGGLRAQHASSTGYHLEIGFDALRTLLHDGVRSVLRQAGVGEHAVAQAFAGLPAHGEDSALLPRFDALLDPLLPRDRCRIGNDMVCSWAGSLAGADGISLVAGTGSIGYGEWQGRSARCGGWGEVFGDEGSAHWLAREGLALFSRMADGRAEPGPLLEIVRRHFDLQDDLDLCAAINGEPAAQRSRLAQCARLVTAAAAAGDAQAAGLLGRAADELAALARGVAGRLGASPTGAVPVSYSGGLFTCGDMLTGPLRAALAQVLPAARLQAPRLGPDLGAALQAARLAGQPLGAAAVQRLVDQAKA